MATMAEKLAMKIEDPVNRHAYSIMCKVDDVVAEHGQYDPFYIVNSEYPENGDPNVNVYVFEDGSKLKVTLNHKYKTARAHIEDFA